MKKPKMMIIPLLFSVMCCVGYMLAFSEKENKRFETNKTFINRLFKPRKDVPQKVEKPENIEEFMQRYSAIHEKRNNNIREMCRLHQNDIRKMKRRPVLLVNEKHKMVYCQTPKVGTVSWCRIMLILAGYKNYKEVMAMKATEVSAAWKTNVTLLSQFSLEKQEQIMDTYTKFMFVRHPFSRLLSAFNDKLGPENKSYGKFTSVYNTILKRFKWDNQEKSNKVQFKDFINMVIDGSYNASHNIHWREMNTICFPCNISYDVIGRFEDLENDSKYILTLTNVTDLKFTSSSGSHLTNSSSHDKISRAYSSVPVPLLADIYNKFKYDFTLFDYEIPLALP